MCKRLGVGEHMTNILARAVCVKEIKKKKKKKQISRNENTRKKSVKPKRKENEDKQKRFMLQQIKKKRLLQVSGYR